ncbi:MAG: hypothetical protein V4591_07780 [Bdellovibrionota bacterium]
MLESIIFHFVFVLFALWAIVYWLVTKRKFEVLKQALLPVILLKTIQFPQHRSLVVRSLAYLQEEYSSLFQCKVEIINPIFVVQEKGSENFMRSLCLLMNPHGAQNQQKSFLVEESLFSSEELKEYVKLKGNTKRLSFQYDFHKDIWNVELTYA